MTGARFARTGRCRFFAGFCALIVMIGMVAIFHSSQQELDEMRKKCEENIEVLRKRWQFAMEQKFEVEKAKDEEVGEEKRTYEQKLKEQNDQHAKEQMEARVNLEKLQQSHKLLESNHTSLVKNCEKSKKQQLEDANSLEIKLQSLRSELQKAKSLQESELALWKEKYNAAVNEKSRLEGLLNAVDLKEDQSQRIRQMESVLTEYSVNCAFKPKSLSLGLMQEQINKPLNPPETTHNAKSGPVQVPSLDKPQNEKSFKELQSVSPGLYHIAINVANNTQNTNDASIRNMSSVSAGIDGDGASKKIQELLPLPFSAQNNRSLIINSVENFQIVPKPLQKMSGEIQETQLKQQPEVSGDRRVSPLSAPRKQTSTQSTKSSEHRVLDSDMKMSMNSSVSTSSSTSLPPLPMPPNKRKQIPAMVAPIPELDQLPKNDALPPANEKSSLKEKDVVAGDETDIDAAIEETQHQENDEGINNRYANVVDDLEAKKKPKDAAPLENNDSGAHEVKDHDLVNEPNFNLPVEDDDNNFFDAAQKHPQAAAREAADPNKHKNDIDNEDDDLGGVGDIAVKGQHLLEADSLNNEVAGDQGKEFPDGLRLEDANEEDEDEDEYANPALRHQGAQAIRN